VVETLHGTSVEDPYRWLEDEGSPEVVSWTSEQDHYARGVLDGLPGRSAIRTRLQALFSIGTLSPPLVRHGLLFYEKRTGTEEQPILYVRKGPLGQDRPLLDPSGLSSDKTSALDWFYPSADGVLLAYGVSEQGTEKSTLRVMDVRTGRDLGESIPGTRACSLEWRPDGTGFFYTRYPEPGTLAPGEENYHRRVFEHTLGEDWRRDPPVFGEGRGAEDWPNVHLSPDGRFLAVSVSIGWTRTDVYLMDLLRGRGFVTVVEGLEALFGVTVRNDRLYLHTNLDAPRYRLLAAELDRPGRESWLDLIREGPDVLEGFLVVSGTILGLYLHDCSSRLSLYDLGGRVLADVKLPGAGSVAGITGEWNGDQAFFGYSSYTTPPTVYRLLLPGGLEVWQRVESDVDPDRYTVGFVRYPSPDGTPLSMFLVHARDRASDSTGPALLTGYGGFNVSHTPAFGRSVLLFLDRGGLYAVAHLRGGGEYGEEWHRAGMRDKKQNVFDDFIAGAQFLVNERHAAPDRLGILGGSNGGLLVGAALTQRPALFRTAVCQVPLLDMLRYHRFRIARLWIPEYGSAEDEGAFPSLLAYSPYHHVVDGTPYPSVLFTTGESDSRVDPMHARKMTARLQAATSSSLPVLLRLEARAGHGQGKPISKVLEEWTDIWSFLFDQLGIKT
jgi:prolyl oligopeptidase